MPLKDGTGPQGKGPKTGRGMGNCAPKNTQQESVSKDTQAMQRPLRRGRGAGRRSNS